jgi:hypothetical protein
MIDLLRIADGSPPSPRATASDRKIDLANEAQRAAAQSAGLPVSQWSAMLAHPTPREDDAPSTFKNSDEELKYLWREDARLEKQRKTECLWT